METVTFNNAYYIKLGAKGDWAERSLSEGVVRIGWKNISLQDINSNHWDTIKKNIKQEFDDRRKKNGSMQDYLALKRFCDATINDVFITFHDGKMYWCNLSELPIEEDDISKFRKTQGGWSQSSLDSSGKIFYSNEMSGKITKTQAFQATLCQYKEEELQIINRIINGVSNPKVAEIEHKKKEICELLVAILTDFHWKDCEILTDLIFQQSGWHRISMAGGSMKYMDFEYVEPINNDRYIVQVKSGAKKSDFLEYQRKFIHEGYRKLFFVSFNPDKSLYDYKNEQENIEILYGSKLATLIFNLGLVDWVLKKSF